jgi:hypothetical protein
MKLIIDRSKWYRGKGSAHSRLKLSSVEQYCCLGQLGLACGYTDNELNDLDSPWNLVYNNGYGIRGVFDKLVLEKEDLERDNSPICKHLMHINDNKILSGEDREKELIKKFAEIDVQVEFIN